MMFACLQGFRGDAQARRRSIFRTVGFGGAGLLSSIWLYACMMQPPAPPPLRLPPVSQTIQPSAAPTPAGRLIKASWYGPGLVGLRTTSGEVFNPRALTAASKTIPIGSVVKVTNPDTGKSVKVRINDRGPFVRGRSLDLSQRAAQKIGIIKKGVARVRVTQSTPVSSSTPLLPKRDLSEPRESVSASR
jgi:rare lipoprotein A